jgi:hypothetical protein
LRVGLPRFISVTYKGEHRAWGARLNGPRKDLE